MFGENDGAWKATYEFHLSVTEVSFYFIAITILKTFMFLPSFILSYFSGGQNSETFMILKKNGKRYK